MHGGEPEKVTVADSLWHDNLKAILLPPYELIGIGNPIRSDDAAGIFVIKELQRRFGKRPGKRIIIHDAITAPEMISLKPVFKDSKMVIFDSAELNMQPGSIVLAKISDSQYGFFSTHNVPLKLIPYFSSKPENIWVLGIQPQDISISEKLSKTVKKAAMQVVTLISQVIEGGPA
ncbi:MAG: hydrogenase maturation protease [Conexivisphaerales archaeon]